MARETVFVLGAGASRRAGGPLLRDFDVAAQAVLEEDSFGSERARDVFRRELVHWTERYPDLDIESLFVHHDFLARQAFALTGQGETAWMGDLAHLRTYANGIVHREYLRYLIFKTIASRVSTTHAPGYDALVRDHLAAGKGAAITLNWDVALDAAVARAGHRVVSGRDEGEDPEVRDADAVPVFHLHGSIDTWACVACAYNETLLLEEATARWEQGRSASCPKCANRLTPFFVPPLSDKFGRAHVRLLARVWEAAQNICFGARHVIIAGYSLPDTDIQTRMFLRDAVDLSHVETVTVVNPDPRAPERFIRAFQGVRSPERILHARATLEGWLGVDDA